MGKARENRASTAVAGKPSIADMVARCIDHFGEAAPAELLRRTTAARRAGDHAQAENLYELAVSAQAELLARRKNNVGWRELATDLFGSPDPLARAD